MVKRLFGMVLIVFVAFPLWCTTRIWWTGTHARAERSDAIVVLGAAQFNGRPSDVLEARLVQAKKVYGEHYAPRIISVGGGAPGDLTTEADSSRRWLASAGIPSSGLIALPTGRDTLQSIIAVQRYMNRNSLHSILLVTDAWHCLRAETMARDHGLRASCAPETAGPATPSATGSVRYLIRETEAYLAYVTLGRIGIHVSDRGSSVAL